MELSAEQLAAFRAHFARLGLSDLPPCIACSQSLFTTPHFRDHGETITYHCTSCGLVMAFDAEVAGVSYTPPPFTLRTNGDTFLRSVTWTLKGQKDAN